MSWLAWLGVGAVLLVGLDRFLLLLEAKGWINYRRHGLSRGGATYHTLELHSIFDPGVRQVLEVKYSEEREDEESGAPPGAEGNGPEEASVPQESP